MHSLEGDEDAVHHLCEGGSDATCVCHVDEDCPGDLLCDTAFFGANQCLECLSHSDCGNGLYCDEGTCGAEGPIGAPCNADVECQSGSCQGDTFGEGNCACTKDLHCSDSEVCDKNIFSPNECISDD